VRTILETIVACEEAVLQDEAETQTVIGEAVRYALAAQGPQLKMLDQAADVPALVAALVHFAVQSHHQPLAERSLQGMAVEPTIVIPPAATSLTAAHHDALANWFCGLQASLHAIHPLAGQILRARLAGFDSRVIAERLELPPGLVRRVLLTIGSRHSGARTDTGAAA
jgi:hypothetical protein